MTTAHDLWRTLRKNLTHRDLYLKRRYPLWTDPVTGLPCRSGPAPANKNAAPRRKAKVIRQSESEQESLQARLLVRAQVRRVLTATQYRRVAYLFGFDTPELSQRDVAEIEGVTKYAVTDAKTQGMDKMKRNSYVWLFWLLCKDFRLPAAYGVEGRGKSRGAYESTLAIGRQKAASFQSVNRLGKIQKAILEGNQEALTEYHSIGVESSGGFPGFSAFEPRPGVDAIESDRFTPRSPYDRQVDDLVDDYVTGGLTALEWRIELVLTYADKQNPDAESNARRKLRQELEWTFGAEGLGVFSERERERRVSAALRSYVTGEEISTWAPSAHHVEEKAETASSFTERIPGKAGG